MQYSSRDQYNPNGFEGAGRGAEVYTTIQVSSGTYSNVAGSTIATATKPVGQGNGVPTHAKGPCTKGLVLMVAAPMAMMSLTAKPVRQNPDDRIGFDLL
jgi:hypothetical protein